MQYAVKRSCGHTTSEQLYGSSGERERRLGWLRTQACPQCKRAVHQAEVIVTAAIEALPHLTGSPSQVSAGWWIDRRNALPRDLLKEVD